jgi:hypothetical protein
MIFIFILFSAAAYWGRRDSALGRRGVRPIIVYGLAFCVMSFNLWAVTRIDDIIANLPSPNDTDLFSTPWLWISALCVGVVLLVISFLTRVRNHHTA